MLRIHDKVEVQSDQAGFTHSVIPEAAPLSVCVRCSFGARGRFQVKVVVDVAHTKSRLQESREVCEPPVVQSLCFLMLNQNV